MTETTNYHLNQWVKDDRIRMEDFNADNEKLDAALAAGPKLTVGSYVGTGKFGQSSPNNLTFAFPPKVVGVVINSSGTLRGGVLFIQGQTKSSSIGGTDSSGGTFELTVSWQGNRVSWYTTNSYSATGPEMQMNLSGSTYYYFALG